MDRQLVDCVERCRFLFSRPLVAVWRRPYLEALYRVRPPSLLHQARVLFAHWSSDRLGRNGGRAENLLLQHGDCRPAAFRSAVENLAGPVRSGHMGSIST